MDIKIAKKVAGIPQVEIPCSPGKLENGLPVVIMHLMVIDAHQILSGAGRIACSPQEAIELAKRITEAAEKALAQ